MLHFPDDLSINHKKKERDSNSISLLQQLLGFVHLFSFAEFGGTFVGNFVYINDNTMNIMDFTHCEGFGSRGGPERDVAYCTIFHLLPNFWLDQSVFEHV